MTQTREERKELTRRAILDAALQMSSSESLVALSLRKIAKEVGVVPTAFYRHFDSVEQLGLVLVDEALDSLRAVLADVRRKNSDLETIVSASVEILIDHVTRNYEHFAFIARERSAGPEQVRVAIRRGITAFEHELATDLGLLPPGLRPTDADLPVVANLLVTMFTASAEDLIHLRSVGGADQKTAAAIGERVRRQAQLIFNDAPS